MDVVEQLEKLLQENRKTCVDSFQYFMNGVLLGVIIWTRKVNKEILDNRDIIEKSPDPSPIIIDFFKHRNTEILGTKLRDTVPEHAYELYVYHVNLNEIELISGLTLLAYLCAKLALRNNERGRAHRAAMYAHEAIRCKTTMQNCFLNENYASSARKSLAIHAAFQRHIKTYAKREEIVAYWRSNIPQNISNEKAGEWLKDSFPNLSVRKLSEYVSQAKKNVKDLPPASKA